MTKSLLSLCVVVSAAAAVLLATSAQADHHKVRRHPAQPSWQAVQPSWQAVRPSWQAVRPKPAGDPIYQSCEAPWRHPEVQCPGNDAGG